MTDRCFGCEDMVMTEGEGQARGSWHRTKGAEQMDTHEGSYPGS